MTDQQAFTPMPIHGVFRSYRSRVRCLASYNFTDRDVLTDCY